MPAPPKYAAKRSKKSLLPKFTAKKIALTTASASSSEQILGVATTLTVSSLDTTLTEKPTTKSQGNRYFPPPASLPPTNQRSSLATNSNKATTVLSDELKQDMAVIKMRNFLDPKKFYKSADNFSTQAQLGTIIEGPTEYYSARLTKKERRTTVLEEFRSEAAVRNYTKKSFSKIQKSKVRVKRFIKPKQRKKFK